MPAGPLPTEATGEELFLHLFSFRALAGILAWPHRSRLCLCSHAPLRLSLSPLRCVPYKEICHWLWGSLVLVSRPVTEVHLQRPFFQGRQPFPSLRSLGVQFKLIRQIQLPRNHSISSVTFLLPFGSYLFLCSIKHEMTYVSQVSPGGLSHFRILFTCCLVTSAL